MKNGSDPREIQITAYQYQLTFLLITSKQTNPDLVRNAPKLFF